MSNEGKKRAEHQYRQFSSIFCILFLPWSGPGILRAMVQHLNMLTSGDLSPVEVCLGPQVMVNGFPSRAQMLVTSSAALVVTAPCGLPIREAKVILLQVWKAKGKLEEHLLSLCRLEKSFSRTPEQLTIFHANKNHTNSLYKEKQVLPSVPHVQ